MKKSGLVISTFLSTLLIIVMLSSAPIAAPSAKENAPPPLHSLLELDLSEEQLRIIKGLVDTTETNRNRLRSEYRELNQQLESAQHAETLDQKKVRELRRLQVVNRDQMRQERDDFHRQVEPELTEDQRNRWHNIRSNRQEWCQQKWMNCSDCNCGTKK